MRKVIWTKKMLIQLNNEYPNTKTKVLAYRMGLTEDQITYKAHKLQIKKSKDQLSKSQWGLSEGLDYYEEKLNFAKSKGFKSLADAYANRNRKNFEQQFKEYLND